MPSRSDVAYTVIGTTIGPVRLAATGGGVCKIALGDESPQAFEEWLVRHVGQPAHDPQARLLKHAEEQLRDYLEGQRQTFDLPLDMRGTPFQKQVWRSVASIPYGKTTTYGQIAGHLGRPNAARAVGAANGSNPLPIVIPCHRVIGADGSLCGYGGGLHIKETLLDLEQAV